MIPFVKGKNKGKRREIPAVPHLPAESAGDESRSAPLPAYFSYGFSKAFNISMPLRAHGPREVHNVFRLKAAKHPGDRFPWIAQIVSDGFIGNPPLRGTFNDGLLQQEGGRPGY